jgi:signal transduction histidine kinase
MRETNSTQKGIKEILWRYLGAVSVRVKISGIILILVFLLGGGITMVVRNSLHQTMANELEARAYSVAQDLASRSTDLILVNNLYALQQLIVETQYNHPDIRYIFIMDDQDQVLVHTFGGGFPSDLTSVNTASSLSHANLEIIETTEGQVRDIAVPIFEGRAGILRIGFTDFVIQRAVTGVTSQMILATVLVSTVGIAAAIFLTWILTQPILQLASAARAVGDGDLTQRIPRWANDEIGAVSEAFNTMVEGLNQAAEERQQKDRIRTKLIQQVITAQEDERKRIARDLHDQTSQAVVSLIVQLKLVETSKEENERKAAITELRNQLRTLSRDVRRMALDLRPGVLDDLGLIQAVQWFAERCSVDRVIDIKVEACSGCFYLPSSESTTLYRVAQEALSNVVRHSGAKKALVSFTCDEETIILSVRDDGVGFNTNQNNEGLGIFGMQERVELLGGKLKIESTTGKGTQVTADIPRPKESVRVEEKVLEGPQ